MNTISYRRKKGFFVGLILGILLNAIGIIIAAVLALDVDKTRYRSRYIWGAVVGTFIEVIIVLIAVTLLGVGLSM